MIDDIKAQIRALVDCETEGWKQTMWILFYLSFIQIWFGPGLHIRMHTTLQNGFLKSGVLIESVGARTDIVSLMTMTRFTIISKGTKIEVNSEGDGAFAIVDIDTRWRHKVTGDDLLGKDVFASFIQRCQMETENIFQTGHLHYPARSHQEKIIAVQGTIFQNHKLFITLLKRGMGTAI